jgi:hypothetical protein
VALTFSNFALPYLRSAKLLALRTEARVLGAIPRKSGRRNIATPIFIIGCGRSGTTVLGKIFMSHPGVSYLREPYHLWRAIDPRTDVTGLHGSISGTRYFLDAADHTPRAQARFNKLIAGTANHRKRVIEKTPHNVARIGWLESLTPNASYIHIVRNGLSVARSIARIMAKPTWRLAFKSRYAQWWGTNHHRWTALSIEGAARGYFTSEVELLATDTQKGAYEWLVSLGEIDRQREALGGRLAEITYTELTADSTETLIGLGKHLGIGAPEDWLAQADDLIHRERSEAGDPLTLPPAMAKRFNELQTRYGFNGRAEISNIGVTGAVS